MTRAITRRLWRLGLGPPVGDSVTMSKTTEYVRPPGAVTWLEGRETVTTERWRRLWWRVWWRTMP